MLELVPKLRLQRQLKNGGNVPGSHRNGAGQPAECKRRPPSRTTSERAPKRIKGAATNMSKQMLHHVRGQQVMIEMRQRRCDHNPTSRQVRRRARRFASHGCTPAVSEASLAGVWPDGWSVSRNATRAVVSAGFRFFPYAGILPPPCSTCRTS